MFETETVGPYLVQILKWGEGGWGMAPVDPPPPPVATPLKNHRKFPLKKLKQKQKQIHTQSNLQTNVLNIFKLQGD